MIAGILESLRGVPIAVCMPHPTHLVFWRHLIAEPSSANCIPCKEKRGRTAQRIEECFRAGLADADFLTFGLVDSFFSFLLPSSRQKQLRLSPEEKNRKRRRKRRKAPKKKKSRRKDSRSFPKELERHPKSAANRHELASLTPQSLVFWSRLFMWDHVLSSPVRE